jgi:hypothetical protein
MSNIGALAVNFHEGSRSEYLAQYIFASYGTAVSVPHQEDVGVDLVCTMTERVGALAWPKHHYTVQVKSTMAPWTFSTKESVRWLVQHPLPLLLCVVEKPTGRIRLYHTLARFLVRIFDMPESLTLIPEDSTQGRSTQWGEGSEFSLGAPILNLTVTDFLDDDMWRRSRDVIDSWLRAEELNLARVIMGLPTYSMPYEYETNVVPDGGVVLQWNTREEGIELVRKTLGEILPWLAEAFRRQPDTRGMVRTALLLRHLFSADDRTPMIGAPFVQTELNKALGLRPEYVFEGVDMMSKALDEFHDRGPR